jgi:hypothetical protein
MPSDGTESKMGKPNVVNPALPKVPMSLVYPVGSTVRKIEQVNKRMVWVEEKHGGVATKILEVMTADVQPQFGGWRGHLPSSLTIRDGRGCAGKRQPAGCLDYLFRQCSHR